MTEPAGVIGKHAAAIASCRRERIVRLIARPKAEVRNVARELHKDVAHHDEKTDVTQGP